MQIIINNSSMKPIYEQIEEQIKVKILEGELIADTMLPSVRSLSKDLRVSALTVKKAYDTLEQEGLVITVHGKGSFVAATRDNLREEEFKKKIENELEEIFRKAKGGGMSSEDIRELTNLMMEDLL